MFALFSIVVFLGMLGIIAKLNDKLEGVESQRDALLRQQGVPLPPAKRPPMPDVRRKLPDHPTAV